MKKLLTYLVTVLMLLISLNAEAQKDTTGFQWTPEQMIGLDAVSDPVLSPDGKYVAYEVRKTLMEGERSEFLTHIWVATTDGSMNRQFTRGEESATNPRFSPDGTYLTFISSRDQDEKQQVYRMYLNGGEAEQVTHAENGVNSYRWSSDGTRIAYTMTDPKTEEEKKREKEKRDVQVVDQEFRYNHIYVETIEEDPENNATQRVTGGDFQVTAFDWSPGGDQIVFAHQPTPVADSRYQSDISVAPSDSGSITPLVTWEGSDRSPKFAPDGSYVVFESSGGKLEPIGMTDIYRVPIEGGTPQGLAHTPDRNANIVEWGPEGRSLLIQEPRRTVTALYRLPVNGDDPQLLTPEDGVYGDYDLSDNGDLMAFTFQQTDTPENIYISDFGKINKKQLTDIHSEVEFPTMGKTEVISWKSKDGTRIEGLLTYPVNYEKGKRYPLILNVHGGPAGVYLQTFTGSGSIYPIQFFASNGYAILRPNPRGSTGYGKEFRYANYRDWGFGDYEDLMSGVDEVIDRGVAHPDSLVEMGWSYGGYMTSYIVTRTDRFKAVSMGAGLPNLISMVNTTDIPTYLAGHMGGYYWESEKLEEIYERHSAIYRLREISTPVQVLHGEQDLRVPTSQGREFYWALKTLGVPTELILYPRTPHGPREPKLIADVPHRILAWFNQYLER